MKNVQEGLATHRRLEPGKFTRTRDVRGLDGGVAFNIQRWQRQAATLGSAASQWAARLVEKRGAEALRSIMGLKDLPAKSGEILLEIILRRHETRSTLMTSNRPIEDWGKLLGDVPAASAILDRLLSRADIILTSAVVHFEVTARGALSSDR